MDTICQLGTAVTSSVCRHCRQPVTVDTRAVNGTSRNFTVPREGPYYSLVESAYWH